MANIHIVQSTSQANAAGSTTISSQSGKQDSSQGNKQTGPKTQEGKKVSSKNAQQFGIFTKGYLVTENHDQLDKQYFGLCQQWGAHDPTRQIMVQSMHQAAISANRLALAQQQMIDAAMQSPNVRHEFAQLAQIDPLKAQGIPAWFFQGPDHPQKSRALYLAAVWDEANELQSYYSDRLVAEVPTRYPNLHHYMMENQKSGTSFVAALGQRFKQSVPSQNLVALKNALCEHYEYHLLWAEDPERFEIYIAGIRGRQMYEGMDLEKSLRYHTAFQNLFHKGCQALDAMDRVEGKGIYAPVQMVSSGHVSTNPQLSSPANQVGKSKVHDGLDTEAEELEQVVLQNEMPSNAKT